MDTFTEAPRYTVYRRADVTEAINEELLQSPSEGTALSL